MAYEDLNAFEFEFPSEFFSICNFRLFSVGQLLSPSMSQLLNRGVPLLAVGSDLAVDSE